MRCWKYTVAPHTIILTHDLKWLPLSVPMKRLGSIDEVLKSVAYLLSDDSSYTTGTNLVVDGGMSSGLKA